MTKYIFLPGQRWLEINVNRGLSINILVVILFTSNGSSLRSLSESSVLESSFFYWIVSGKKLGRRPTTECLIKHASDFERTKRINQRQESSFRSESNFIAIKLRIDYWNSWKHKEKGSVVVWVLHALHDSKMISRHKFGSGEDYRLQNQIFQASRPDYLVLRQQTRLRAGEKHRLQDQIFSLTIVTRLLVLHKTTDTTPGRWDCRLQDQIF